MKTPRYVEIAVGIFVALGIAALVMLAMKVSNVAEVSLRNGYNVIARFDNIGGLKVRAPVTMAGVKIGRVTAISFDQDDFSAEVTLTIDARYDRLPADTSAAIYTAGILGENYVGLEAGAEEQTLTDGSEITITQSAMILERLIGRMFLEGIQK